MPINLEAVRADFPILARKIRSHPLVYLDSANTSQKPKIVIDTVDEFYSRHNANVSRAMHILGNEATEAFEGARSFCASFIGAASADEVIFTKNATESLNLAANTLGASLKAGDEIVVSVMEHHSNIVPWQLLCDRSGAKLRWFDITDDGHLDLDAADRENLINERTKIVSLTWVSNVLGTVNPIRTIADQAHAVGAIMIVDGSQGVPHRPTSVNDLQADLLAFTGHKTLGPTGIGVLWGRSELLDSMPPFLGGGEMIESVAMTGSTFAPPPYRFEAGTPPVAQAVGLGAGLEYLDHLGMENVAQHEQMITKYMIERLREIDKLTIYGPLRDEDRGATVSFGLDGVHPHDLMQMLDVRGIAVRGGHHCARPLHIRLGVKSSTRISAYLYTKKEEIDALADAVVWARDFFARKAKL